MLIHIYRLRSLGSYLPDPSSDLPALVSDLPDSGSDLPDLLIQIYWLRSSDLPDPSSDLLATGSNVFYL